MSAVRGPLRKSQATPAGRLSLSVQYQTKRAAPARAQCRRWVKAALALDGGVDCRLTLRFVLTFDYHSANMVHADIVICVPVIEREARQQNKDVRAHFAHMVVHGVLHAHGFDHVIARDAKQMESLEGRILARFGISNPYL